jgi:MFS transporter, ACS family, tartrate transporter
MLLGAVSSDDADASVQVDPAVVARKLDRHLVGWFFSLGILCYLDRTNLSFAAVQLNQDLGLDCATYGLGSGVFFLGYALFQVPSSMALSRLGAPRWLGLIIAVWGVTAAAFAFTTGPAMFLALRLLLGAAEAGAFPGIWAHMSRFYTPSQLGSAYSKVATCTALAQVVGAPVAAGILAMDGTLGLRGWQWLFLLEGAPTIVFGVALRLRLAPTPSTAQFLTRQERVWLARRQDDAAEQSGGSFVGGSRGTGSGKSSRRWEEVVQVVKNWRIWWMGVAALLVFASMYGVIFFGPLIIQGMLETNDKDVSTAAAGAEAPSPSSPGALGLAAEAEAASSASCGKETSKMHGSLVVLMSAVPFAAAAAAMVINAKFAEKAGERHRHAALPTLFGGVCLGGVPVALYFVGAWLAFAFLVLAAAGIWAFHGVLRTHVFICFVFVCSRQCKMLYTQREGNVLFGFYSMSA